MSHPETIAPFANGIDGAAGTHRARCYASPSGEDYLDMVNDKLNRCRTAFMNLARLINCQ